MAINRSGVRINAGRQRDTGPIDYQSPTQWQPSAPEQWQYFYPGQQSGVMGDAQDANYGGYQPGTSVMTDIQNNTGFLVNAEGQNFLKRWNPGDPGYSEDHSGWDWFRGADGSMQYGDQSESLNTTNYSDTGQQPTGYQQNPYVGGGLPGFNVSLGNGNDPGFSQGPGMWGGGNGQMPQGLMAALQSLFSQGGPQQQMQSLPGQPPQGGNQFTDRLFQ